MVNLKRTTDLKQYILNRHPELETAKFDVVKIGARSYIYYVDNNGNLAREQVFHGCLSTAEGLPRLQEAMDRLIDYAIQKWKNS